MDRNMAIVGTDHYAGRQVGANQFVKWRDAVRAIEHGIWPPRDGRNAALPLDGVPMPYDPQIRAGINLTIWALPIRQEPLPIPAHLGFRAVRSGLPAKIERIVSPGRSDIVLFSSRVATTSERCPAAYTTGTQAQLFYVHPAILHRKIYDNTPQNYFPFCATNI